MYYDKDADLKWLKGKTVAIIGYGSQGHAHALNLKDSGIKVVVGLREGSKSRAEAEKAKLKVLDTAEAAKIGDVIMVLAPDTAQAEIYEESIKPSLTAGKSLVFAHGFNIRFNCITPPKDVDVWMIAPKSPGHMVRRTYTEGFGTPCLLAVHQDATGHAKDIALAYAKGIGGTRAGVLETSFKEETETDLFGEQVVLCGGLSELIRSGYETLVNAGYQSELAYFECLHELKLITDLIYEKGITGMRDSISMTAKYGDISRGKRIIDSHVRENMKKILAEIQSGEFAKEWIKENKNGLPNFNKITEAEKKHPIEQVGRTLRQMMNWIKK